METRQGGLTGQAAETTALVTNLTHLNKCRLQTKEEQKIEEAVFCCKLSVDQK